MPPPLLIQMVDEGRLCNTGGPRSRTRTQPVNTSLLGRGRRSTSMASITRAALDFGELDPFAVVEALFAQKGLRDPEQLRVRYELPQEPCICREANHLKRLPVSSAEPDEVLRQVALLSLSTPYHYDPRRPILLTRNALTRKLELFTGKGFYA